MDQIKELETQINQLKAENANLGTKWLEERNNLTTQLDKAKKELLELCEKPMVTVLSIQLKELRTLLRVEQAQVDALKKENSRLQDEQAQMSAQNIKLLSLSEQQKSTLRAQLDKAKKGQQRLQRKLSKLQPSPNTGCQLLAEKSEPSTSLAQCGVSSASSSSSASASASSSSQGPSINQASSCPNTALNPSAQAMEIDVQRSSKRKWPDQGSQESPIKHLRGCFK